MNGTGKRTFIRALTLIAVALVVGTSLTACDSALPGVSTSHPVVGRCTDLTLSPEIDSTSNANPSVLCSKPHTMQTFGVNTIGTPLSTWKARPGQQQLQRLQSSLCSLSALRIFVGAVAGDSLTNVSIHGYFPTRADWADGARAVSCDVSVNDPDGGPRSITHSLAQVMSKPESSAIRTCYRQKAEPGGGWSLTGAVTTCDKKHSSQDIDYWVTIDTATPTPAAISAICGPPAQGYVGPSRIRSILVSGVVVLQANKTAQLRCTIGGESAHGYVTGAILAG
ncbi:hypothetical protein GCM10027414_17960 [Humibacter ginsengiterrae]